jgi:hypothetical protein
VSQPVITIVLLEALEGVDVGRDDDSGVAEPSTPGWPPNDDRTRYRRVGRGVRDFEVDSRRGVTEGVFGIAKHYRPTVHLFPSMRHCRALSSVSAIGVDLSTVIFVD